MKTNFKIEESIKNYANNVYPIVSFGEAVPHKINVAASLLAHHLNVTNFQNTWHDAVGTKTTSVGRTSETVSGIPMNSRPGPDFKINSIGFEMKAGILGDSSLQTLFCKEAGRGVNRQTLDDFATLDADGRESLYQTMHLNAPRMVNGKVIDLNLANNGDFVLTADKIPYCTWSKQLIDQTSKAKLGHVVVRLKAEERHDHGVRQFRFSNLSLHYGFAFGNLVNLFQSGGAAIDLRCHFEKDQFTKKGLKKIRNHGTAVRADDERFHELFQYSINL